MATALPTAGSITDSRERIDYASNISASFHQGSRDWSKDFDRFPLHHPVEKICQILKNSPQLSRMDVFSRQAAARITCHAKRYFAINVWLSLVFPEPKNVLYPNGGSSRD